MVFAGATDLNVQSASCAAATSAAAEVSQGSKYSTCYGDKSLLPGGNAHQESCTTASICTEQTDAPPIAGCASSNTSSHRSFISEKSACVAHQYVLIAVDGTWVQAKEMYKVGVGIQLAVHTQ